MVRYYRRINLFKAFSHKIRDSHVFKYSGVKVVKGFSVISNLHLIHLRKKIRSKIIICRYTCRHARLLLEEVGFFCFIYYVISMLLMPSSNKSCSRDRTLVLKIIRHYVFFLFHQFSRHAKLFFSLSSLNFLIQMKFLLNKT